jgi:hypothetical protein
VGQYVWKFQRADLTTLLHRIQKSYIPTTLEELIRCDLEEYKRKEEEAGITTITEEKVDEEGTTTTTTTTTTTKLETVVVKKASTAKVDSKLEKKLAVADIPTESAPPSRTNTPAVNFGDDPDRPDVVENMRFCQQRGLGTTHIRGEIYYDEPPTPTVVSPDDKRNLKVTVPHESSDEVVIGLRVYTHRDVACSVQGRLRREGMFV